MNVFIIFIHEKRESKLEKERRQKTNSNMREMIRKNRNVCALSVRVYKIEWIPGDLRVCSRSSKFFSIYFTKKCHIVLLINTTTFYFVKLTKHMQFSIVKSNQRSKANEFELIEVE